MSEKEIVVTDELVALSSLRNDIEMSHSEGQSDAANMTVDYEAGQLSVVYSAGDDRFVMATFGLVELKEVPAPEKRGPFELYASKDEQAKVWRYDEAIKEARWP